LLVVSLQLESLQKELRAERETWKSKHDDLCKISAELKQASRLEISVFHDTTLNTWCVWLDGLSHSMHNASGHHTDTVLGSFPSLSQLFVHNDFWHVGLVREINFLI